MNLETENKKMRKKTPTFTEESTERGSTRADGFLEEKEAHAATTIFLATLFSFEDAPSTPISGASSSPEN